MSSELYRQSNPCIFLFKILYNRLYYIASFSASGIATAVVCFSNCTLLHRDMQTGETNLLQPIKRSKGYYKGPPYLCSSTSGSVLFSSRLLMQAWHARVPDMHASSAECHAATACTMQQLHAPCSIKCMLDAYRVCMCSLELLLHVCIFVCFHYPSVLLFDCHCSIA